VQGTRETICANLAKMLARSDIRFHCDNPDVHESVVIGDVAVVRLTWTRTDLEMRQNLKAPLVYSG
jgi:hypothetical protein